MVANRWNRLEPSLGLSCWNRLEPLSCSPYVASRADRPPYDDLGPTRWWATMQKATIWQEFDHYNQNTLVTGCCEVSFTAPWPRVLHLRHPPRVGPSSPFPNKTKWKKDRPSVLSIDLFQLFIVLKRLELSLHSNDWTMNDWTINNWTIGRLNQATRLPKGTCYRQVGHDVLQTSVWQLTALLSAQVMNHSLFSSISALNYWVNWDHQGETNELRRYRVLFRLYGTVHCI
jgi:hypothetical protein